MNQGSPEWLQARCGLVTASRISDVLAKVKTGEAASRKDYRAQLIAERLSGKPAESFSNAAMQWGTETEPFARAAYELATDYMVDQVGLIRHPDIIFAGASPDGLINHDGLIEIKCPNTATHIEYALSGKAPAKYQNQMLWQMECTGREWCDFASFDPRLPSDMQLFIVRFERDQTRIDEMKMEVMKFLMEVEESIDKLRKVFNKGLK
jgi:putative phage-type endonuclease